MEDKEMICIVCPIGCHITVAEDESSSTGYSVTGNKCKRGEEYGVKELTNPTRVITTTVKINKAHLKRLPVRTNGSVPKDKIFECMKVINTAEVEAPVKEGEVILKNILNTGVDLVASRSM